jgi:hypothetical protein
MSATSSVSSNSRNTSMPTLESWQTDSRLASGRANKAAGVASLGASEAGIPQPVTQLKASSFQSKIGGATMTTVQINHKISSSDQTFHHANVWVTGLGGNPNPQLLSSSTASPHTMILPNTGEKVSLTVQSVGKDGSLLPLSSSPSTPVTI